MAEIAALVGDPARANMLTALMNGEALSASDLAWHAGVTPQTASGHLARMMAADLIKVTAQGRHRYYKLASPAVGRMLETIYQVAGEQSAPRRRLPSYVDTAMREARTCYDHLAGVLAVMITEAMVSKRYLVLNDEAGVVTRGGRRFFTGFGIDLDAACRTRRHFCRVCIDLTERRPHVSGALGAAFCARCFELGWITRMKDTRAVAVTPKGAAGFREALGIEFGPSQVRRRAA
ncbi:MAG TPA: winged helix-turn-helix domain-containing protein [Candidatus Cybelea sp.]|nr:winged helix-turn-helix domain-containing protein [Candidatus Cybelea sp.]